MAKIGNHKITGWEHDSFEEDYSEDKSVRNARGKRPECVKAFRKTQNRKFRHNNKKIEIPEEDY